MADLKISQLPAASLPLSGTELIPVVQSGENKYATPTDIKLGLVKSDTTGISGAGAITNIVTISQANYDALAVKDANTVYIIV